MLTQSGRMAPQETPGKSLPEALGGGGLVSKSCQTLVNLWTVAFQAPLSMGFPKQEYWGGFPFPSPGIYNFCL